MEFLVFSKPDNIGGLTKLIGNLITSVGAVWLGIIIFTVVLKLVTLIFDYYSRASMRRSSLKMKEMRPQLEKLQVQFKDNKELYQQKVMALYKKEGYSVFSSCLPTIITLVIFIVVLNNFQNFSEYKNKYDIYSMAESYNSVVLDGFELEDNDVLSIIEKNGKQKDLKVDVDKLNGNTGNVEFKQRTDGKWELYTTKGYVKAIYSDDNCTTLEKYEVYENTNSSVYKDYLDTTGFDSFSAYLLDMQQQRAADTYKEERESFLWVKNIWVQDRADKSPIQEYKDIKGLGDVLNNGEETYNKLTIKLKNQTEAANGYYILVALTILTTLLSQFISMRANKDQMELQTVDGQGASTQKMMLWMMPIMMAIFAFIYTAAFSLYIITSTVLSTITTIIINKIVDYRVYKSKDKEVINIVRRG